MFVSIFPTTANCEQLSVNQVAFCLYVLWSVSLFSLYFAGGHNIFFLQNEKYLFRYCVMVIAYFLGIGITLWILYRLLIVVFQHPTQVNCYVILKLIIRVIFCNCLCLFWFVFLENSSEYFQTLLLTNYLTNHAAATTWQ